MSSPPPDDGRNVDGAAAVRAPAQRPRQDRRPQRARFEELEEVVRAILPFIRAAAAAGGALPRAELLAPLLQTEATSVHRALTALRRIGVVELWREKAWPTDHELRPSATIEWIDIVCGRADGRVTRSARDGLVCAWCRIAPMVAAGATARASDREKGHAWTLSRMRATSALHDLDLDILLYRWMARTAREEASYLAWCVIQDALRRCRHELALKPHNDELSRRRHAVATAVAQDRVDDVRDLARTHVALYRRGAR